MNDPRLSNIDLTAWAYENLIGQTRDWTPRARVRNVTATANVNPLDGLILASGTSTLTLETAVGCDGRLHYFKYVSGTVTIACTGSETVGGASTFSLTDWLLVISNGTNWEILGKPAAAATVGGIVAPVGQCKLSRNSATELILSPYRGKYLTFASGVTVEVPSAGVTLANTGLSADTLYYIYAVTSDDEEVTSLEASTTGYDIDASYGVAKKQGVGNDTRLLQGMIKTNASSQFVDNAAQRLVRTWNNDNGVTLLGATVSGATSAGPSAVTSVGASNGGLEMLLWAGEFIDVSWYGYHKNSSAGATMTVQMYLNGSVTTFGIAQLNMSGTADEWHAFHVRNVAATGLEGYNFINGYHTAGSGTTNINSSSLTGHTSGL